MPYPRSTLRRRGTAYLLVLAVTSMLVALGVTSVMVGRIDVQSQRLEHDQAQARLIALGAIELVRYNLENTNTWRSGHPHDTWLDPVDAGVGTYQYKLVDETDRDLTDDLDDPVRLYVMAGSGDATRVYSVLMHVGKALTQHVRLNDPDDDAGQDLGATGVTTTTDSYALIGYETPTNAVAGVRFSNLPILQGATILSATVQFSSDNNHPTPGTLTIYGEASDHAAAFLNQSDNLSDRDATAAQITWEPGPWTQDARGPDQKTPDLSVLLQEVIDRPGWSAGNAIALMFEAAGGACHIQTAETPGGVPAALTVTYEAPGLTADFTTLRQEVVETP